MLRPFQGVWPQIDPEAYVSEFACIIGNVEVRANASIWPGAVIRADTGRIVIGENTCIQDNSTVHADRDCQIGPNSAIGHNVLCHADTVGSFVLIGSGSTVNGGTIGDYCIVGSGAVILEGEEIPSYSMVTGVPGKIRGKIREKHVQLIQGVVKDYIEKARIYRSENLV
jgi:carbonic anhydrase/acetyltransferase-like protein (isoleucine patch superfamily)